MLLLAWLPSIAAGGIRFRLLDTRGHPVPYARVSLFGSTGSVAADAGALFTLSPLPRPPFLLSVTGADGALLGVVRVVVVQQEGIQDLRLAPMEHLEVTVQTGVAPTTIAPPAAGATLLSLEERGQTVPPRVTDMIREAPGTESRGSGHPAVPSIRGMAGGRTLILLDGARVTAERRAGPSATYLDPFSLESLEIVRGPGSVTYGSDAMGGILHGRTPIPGAEKPAGRFEAGLGHGIGMASGAAEVDLSMPRGGLLVQVHQRAFDEYDSPEGEVPDSGARDRGFLVKSLVTTERSRWTLGLRVDQSRDVGKPRREPSGAMTRYPEEDSTRLTASALLPPPWGADSLEMDLFLGSYGLITEREERTAGLLLDRSDVRSGDAALRLVATLPVARGAFRVGLDAWSRFDLETATTNVRQDPNGTTRTEEEAIESADRLDAGIFLERSVPVLAERLTLAGGVRGQGVWARNEGGLAGDQSRSTGTATGYASATWAPGRGWSTTLQAARGFREPGLSDLYFTGVTGRGFITGKPDLEREVSRQIDLAVRHAGARSRLAAYAYHYTIEDVIERFRPDPSMNVFDWRNRGEAEITGAEIESEWRLPGGLSLRLAYGQARGVSNEDGEPLDDVPARHARASLGHGAHGRVWWRGAWSYAWRDDRPGPEELEMPGFGVLDLSGGLKAGGGIEVRLLAGNVLDRTHPASPESDAVIAPGRNASLVVAGNFGGGGEAASAP